MTELQPIAQVRLEGGRSIKRVVPYYNLDMIVSVGYRVNSISGTRFCINQRLVTHAQAK